MDRRGTAAPALPLAPIAAIGGIAMALFIVLTLLVTSHTSLSIDAQAADIADDLRAPWLDHAARIVTATGPIAVVGPIVLAGAALLAWYAHRARAAALVGGVALTWIATQIIKAAVDRPRPPAPLVHAAGSSFPSGHAANSMGYFALGIALVAIISSRRWRIAAVAVGALLAVLIALSRVYLRAHYFSDVIGGEALAVTIYAGAALAALAWIRTRSAS